jgi:hypothetical protein
MITLIFLIVLLSVRGLECYLFIRKVSKACHQYDWKYVNENDLLLLEIIKNKYYLNNEWSAYNFLFLKGPSPITLFFSLKPMKIEKQYNEEAVKKLKKYEII